MGEPTITLCYPYYCNPLMLAEHYRQWAAWDDDLRERVEVVIFDDASPDRHALDVPRPDGLPDLRIYRILQDVRWGWPQARNGCAKKARGKWLILTDMDHAIEPEPLRNLLDHPPDPSVLWTFPRFDVGKGGKLTKVKVHFNSFMVTRQLFGMIGGYDESFGDLYAGKDGEFRRRAERICDIGLLSEPARLIRYQRDIIEDAGTVGVVRKDKRDAKLAADLLRQLESDPERRIRFLDFEFVRQL